MMNHTRLVIHAAFGGAIGFLTSIIFLLLYYGTQFDIPVSDAIRLKAALTNTAYIVIVIFGILFWKDIRNMLSAHTGDDSEDENK